jgi:hypothetical protein
LDIRKAGTINEMPGKRLYDNHRDWKKGVEQGVSLNGGIVK